MALIIGGLTLLSSSCGSSEAGAGNCPPSEPPSAEQWKQALAGMERSIQLAEQGKGQAAVDEFFTRAHDPLHLAAATVCRSDASAARRLTKALDKLHFEFDPDKPQALRDLLKAIERTLPSVSKAAGLPSG